MFATFFNSDLMNRVNDHIVCKRYTLLIMTRVSGDVTYKHRLHVDLPVQSYRES